MCLFCKIANNEIKSYKIYEDDEVLAFLDISQTTLGHTLVIPKKHYANILEIDKKTCDLVFNAVSLITNNLKDKLGTNSFNILNNCGPIAGQTIEHFHVHIIPRYENDNFKVLFSVNNLSNEDFENLVDQLKIK